MQVFCFSRLPGRLIVAENREQARRIAIEAQQAAGLHAPTYLGDFFAADTTQAGVVEMHR